MNDTNKDGVFDAAANEQAEHVNHTDDALNTAPPPAEAIHDEDISLSYDQLDKNPLEELTQENGQLKDQLVRMHADMENLRKRTQEEITKAHKFSIEKFAESMVPVHDSLEKALEDNSGSIETLREGVELTAKQLNAALERNGVLPVDPKGEKFDPNFHQAISMVPSEEPSGTVVQVLQKGYQINDRVLRPALVMVSQ